MWTDSRGKRHFNKDNSTMPLNRMKWEGMSLQWKNSKRNLHNLQ